MSPTNTDPYLTSRPDGNKNFLFSAMPIEEISERLPVPNKSKLFYHINRLINVYYLYISSSVAPDILTVAHGKGHSRFSRCYKIIIRSWFICGLTKLFCTFIQDCPRSLALETKQHLLYDLFQPIESSFILFFTLTLDFMLTLYLSKKEYNVMISVTYKFSKYVIFIEDTDMWLAEQ